MLTSAKNPKVAAAVRLKKRALREEERRFLVEGAQGVAEALAEDGALESLFIVDDLDPLAVRARQAGVAVEPVTPRLMERLTSTVTPQGIVGIAPFVDVPRVCPLRADFRSRGVDHQFAPLVGGIATGQLHIRHAHGDGLFRTRRRHHQQHRDRREC